MSSTAFTARKFAWLEQLAGDAGLSALDMRFGVLIAKHWNEKTGDAWPGQKGLIVTLGVTVDGLRKSALRLRDRGHLDYVAGRGMGVTTRYRPTIQGDEKPRPASGLSAPKTQTDVGLFDEVETQTPVGENPDARSLKTQTGVGVIPCKEHQIGTPRGTRAKTSRACSLPECCPSEAEIIAAQDRFNELGLAVDARFEAERFRNHAEQNGRVCKGANGWSAAWRNWTLKAVEYARQRRTAPSYQPRQAWNGIDQAVVMFTEDENP